MMAGCDIVLGWLAEIAGCVGLLGELRAMAALGELGGVVRSRLGWDGRFGCPAGLIWPAGMK